jgi:hypothetical protein
MIRRLQVSLHSTLLHPNDLTLLKHEPFDSGYYKLMVESAIMLGAPNRTFAEQEMLKVLVFETVLANVSLTLFKVTFDSFNHYQTRSINTSACSVFFAA